MSTYYAVKTGRTPGVYSTWDECQQQGYSGATFLRCNSRLEALRFIGACYECYGSVSGTVKNVPLSIICADCYREAMRRDEGDDASSLVYRTTAMGMGVSSEHLSLLHAVKRRKLHCKQEYAKLYLRIECQVLAKVYKDTVNGSYDVFKEMGVRERKLKKQRVLTIDDRGDNDATTTTRKKKKKKTTKVAVLDLSTVPDSLPSGLTKYICGDYFNTTGSQATTTDLRTLKRNLTIFGTASMACAANDGGWLYKYVQAHFDGRAKISPTQLRAAATRTGIKEKWPVSSKLHDRLQSFGNGIIAFDRARPILAVRLRAFLSPHRYQQFAMAVPGVYGHYKAVKAYVTSACDDSIGSLRAEYSSMLVRELKEKLKALGLTTTGRKAELVERLVSAVMEEQDEDDDDDDEEEEDVEMTAVVDYTSWWTHELVNECIRRNLNFSGTRQELLARLQSNQYNNNNDDDDGYNTTMTIDTMLREKPSTRSLGRHEKGNGWVLRYIQQRCSGAQQQRILTQCLRFVFAECRSAIDKEDIDTQLLRFVYHSVRCERLLNQCEFFLWPLVKPYLHQTSWKHAITAIPGVAKYNALELYQQERERVTSEIALDEKMKTLGFTDQNIISFKTSSVYSDIRQRFIKYYKSFDIDELANMIVTYTRSDTSARRALLERELRTKYDRAIRSDSQLCKIYIAGEKCVYVSEIAAIVELTGYQFDTGGHRMYSHNHETAETNLILYVYRDQLKWSRALKRVKNELVEVSDSEYDDYDDE